MKKLKSRNFWPNLRKPIFVLAPMANVTDAAFRKIIVKYGKPDVIWTEFVSADGLMSSGKEKLLIDLQYSKAERPTVAQLFTGHPEAMKGSAKIVKDLGFDGLDINMGCPDRAVEKQGGGAAMIKNPTQAVKIIRAAQEGVGSSIPVTVKTRLGYNKVDMDWLETLINLNLPVLTIHLRTRKEMSNVPAHWELMPEIVRLRDKLQAHFPPERRTLIIGNGDVQNLVEAKKKVVESGCDGVMIGRGIFGTPWLFEDQKSKNKNLSLVTMENQKSISNLNIKTPEQRLKIMLEHTVLFEKMFLSKQADKKIKNFAVMKKHFKAYVSGWDGAKELRAKLMETNNAKEVKKVVVDYLAV